MADLSSAVALTRGMITELYEEVDALKRELSTVQFTATIGGKSEAATTADIRRLRKIAYSIERIPNVPGDAWLQNFATQIQSRTNVLAYVANTVVTHCKVVMPIEGTIDDVRIVLSDQPKQQITFLGFADTYVAAWLRQQRLPSLMSPIEICTIDGKPLEILVGCELDEKGHPTGVTHIFILAADTPDSTLLKYVNACRTIIKHAARGLSYTIQDELAGRVGYESTTVQPPR